LSEEPIPPSRLQPGCPRDLETICLKCLQKDPHQRYPSAGALAEDVRRFLEGGLIQARGVGLVERLWSRWPRRPDLGVAAASELRARLVAGRFALQAHRIDEQLRTEKRQYAVERAQLAAMNGDADGAAAVIAEAESLGASPGQMHLLRGQVAFHRGDVEAA